MKAKSYWGWIELQGNRVLVHPNFKQGDTKTIPLSAIASVSFKPCWLLGYGFIEVITSGHVQEDTWLKRKKHHTRIDFGWGKTKQFAKVRDAINAAIDQQTMGSAGLSIADQLSRYASLKEQGHLTEGEFEAFKRKLLSA